MNFQRVGHGRRMARNANANCFCPGLPYNAKLSPSSRFTGAIHTPNAAFTLSGATEVHCTGSVGRTVPVRSMRLGASSFGKGALHSWVYAADAERPRSFSNICPMRVLVVTSWNEI